MYVLQSYCNIDYSLTHTHTHTHTRTRAFTHTHTTLMNIGPYIGMLCNTLCSGILSHGIL